MEKEIWKPVEGFDGRYLVSNLGRVKSVSRITHFITGISRREPERILSPVDNGYGYMYVNLSKNNKTKQHAVHRLVASAFIPNPYNHPQVNHKNEIKSDNRAENLEWCTCRYNIVYGTARTRGIETRNLSGGRSAEKEIYQYDLNGNYIKSFKSIAKAARETGYSETTIRDNCNGKSKRTGNFMYRRVKKDKIKPYRHNTLRRVAQYTPDMELIAEYESMAEAARTTHSNASKIHECCKGTRNIHNGCRWRYRERDL